jgi:putative hemolysin
MAESHSLLIRSPESNLTVSLAQTAEEIRAAQRLRYRVFVDEMGAHLSDATEDGLDQDAFDPFCDHLVVRDSVLGQVIGAYRILSYAQAAKAGGFYSETEFDLSRILALAPQLVEVGRSCVHPDYRRGPAITLLWAGLAQYMECFGHRYLIGCASISMNDGGHNALALFQSLKAKHLSPPEWRVFPFRPIPLDRSHRIGEPSVPPLLKGYLRLGAYICGEPAWDPEFGTADLLVLLPMSRLNPRYAWHFLGKG